MDIRVESSKQASEYLQQYDIRARLAPSRIVTPFTRPQLLRIRVSQICQKIDWQPMLPNRLTSGVRAFELPPHKINIIKYICWIEKNIIKSAFVRFSPVGYFITGQQKSSIWIYGEKICLATESLCCKILWFITVTGIRRASIAFVP